MIRVLVIGYAPDAVDYTDPLAPPGVDAKKVADGIEVDLRKMRALGWNAEHLNIGADDGLRQKILDHLAGRQYDCIVVGAGVRVTTNRVEVFETVVNAVREGASHTPLAFNGSPDSSAEAASRVLGRR
ncbi:hypothetical protein tb265_19510 [Gemmatimonadetes bacterium T265]|nr:hypothetical protein tb265_19510 [Gemmatimonadetes bacterium T265]